MKIESFFKNITIKQANIYTMIIIFLFSVVFVSLLVSQIYKDYEQSLVENIIVKNLDTKNVKLVEQKKEILKSILIKTILAIVTLSFILFGIAFGVFKIFNALLQKDTEQFLDFFKNAAHDDRSMDENTLFFQDFKLMVGHINSMLDIIREQKDSLRELNVHLEDRVREKTANLKLINENLVKEKSHKDEILQSQKEFLRYTIHETNTPLSVILTSIELFVMKNQKDRQLSKIEAAAKNIFNIYDDLSYLVKKDQVEYPKAAIEIELFLISRLDFFAEVAELSKVRFEYISDFKGRYIYFNETKLQRIIDNTITNAIKYTLAYEIVHVSLKQEGVFAELSMGSLSKTIKNTDRIFDAYYRENKTQDGFGIGLQLVNSICKEEDVVISLDSSDERTTFTYKFKMMGE
ncbi:HAMP domain-containing sensor histidine kinase [Sulfurimonas sp. HSL-1716]|uniref:sensor histidine kinase n=1 Tax=Hydrocurvibacter sulfurireducens TaxID=3131937 RepID=UPI0031F759CA